MISSVIKSHTQPGGYATPKVIYRMARRSGTPPKLLSKSIGRTHTEIGVPWKKNYETNYSHQVLKNKTITKKNKKHKKPKSKKDSKEYIVCVRKSLYIYTFWSHHCGLVSIYLICIFWLIHENELEYIS